VRNQLNLGEMPPFDETQPSGEEIDALSSWVAEEMRRAERSALANDGRVLMRRLNRFEYANTLEDLLGVRFPDGESPLELLPPDGEAEGFDKVSAALLLDPSLLRRYYEVARKVADKAIVDGEPEFPTETMRLEFEDVGKYTVTKNILDELGVRVFESGLQLVNGEVRGWNNLSYPGDEQTSVTPIPGFYRFTLRAVGALGEDGKAPRVRVWQTHPRDDEETIMEMDLEAGKPQEYTVTTSRDALGGAIKVGVVDGVSLTMRMVPYWNFRSRNQDLAKAGDHAEVIRLDGRKFAEGWGGHAATPDPDKVDVSRFPRAYFDFIEVEGPLYEDWPPRFQQMYLGENSEALTDRQAQLRRAREALERFLPRAFRRPIERGEIEPFLGVIETELANGETFHESMRVALAAVLTSPKFLYIVESSEEQAPRPLNEFELASRLSYYLWSSMPDQELFGLAREGRLSQPKVLRQQVARMMKDPKAGRFVDGFARQWLHTDEILAFDPDEHLFREYDKYLGEAMEREPLEFFRTVMERDLSLLNFIDSDFLVVNERLAEHYGIDGVEGAEFRPIRKPEDSVRGGLLAMAGVHLAGSDGLRTKPVTRAVYVREVLFNDPPDPPPPNAGEVEPNIKGQKLTVRERLIKHQEIESCASCHRRLDPYGLALENFNVIGRWRTQEDGQDFGRRKNTPAIDPSGRLPNGEEFASFAEYREALLAQSDRFRRGMAEKMFTYALGRPVGPGDEPALDHVVQHMNASNDTLLSLVEGVVATDAFRAK